MGTGFNSKIIKDTSPKQKVSYLTPINFSPTNVAVVTHAMEQAQVVGKESVRQRWTKSHSIRATIISHVLDVCGLKQLQDVSADLQANRIKIYGKKLNPFDESLDKDSLDNIESAKPVPENVANFLLNIEKTGEDLRKQFITECAEDQNRFDKPIKKNQVLNFAGAPKMKKITLGNKVIELRMQRELFG
ncbi:uncharacterized protein TNCV_2144661 [Trichonephila clavipes]|nr:uncharacterized protein TNCV_2144661 [Trichonephila clavipes]